MVSASSVRQPVSTFSRTNASVALGSTSVAFTGTTTCVASERGDKLRAAQNGAWACLEVDQFDRFEHSGWSVLATGRMVALPPRHSQELERLHVVPWALHGESWFVELAIEALSGRSIRRF